MAHILLYCAFLIIIEMCVISIAESSIYFVHLELMHSHRITMVQLTVAAGIVGETACHLF